MQNLFFIFNFHRRVVSIGKMSVSKTEVFSSNLNAPAKFSLSGKEKCDFYISLLTFSRKISLIGKAVVLKTIAHLSLAGSSPASSAKFRGRGAMELAQFITNE